MLIMPTPCFMLPLQIIFSIVSIAVGFQYLACGGGGGRWTMISLFCSFFSLFTFVVSIAYIAFLSAKDNYNFIHTDFNASTSEVHNHLVEDYSVIFCASCSFSMV